MSKMLGRSGAWFYAFPCGPTHRVMRKSGRMAEKQQFERELRDALDVVRRHPEAGPIMLIAGVTYEQLQELGWPGEDQREPCLTCEKDPCSCQWG